MDKTSGGSVTRTVTYYPVAGAMRINSTLYYILKDHLGSASVVTDASGNILGEQRYYPFGETRVTTETIYTDRLFTGQREMAGLGIYHFNARFLRSAPEAERRGYSPKLGRFLSADTIVPSYANPQYLNRYSYTLNNPIRYTDPSGHRPCDDAFDCSSGPRPPIIQTIIEGGGGSGGGGVPAGKVKNKPRDKITLCDLAPKICQGGQYNPLTYDTIGLQFEFDLKLGGGIEFKPFVLLNGEKFRNLEWADMDGAVGFSIEVTVGASAQVAGGITILGSDGSVLDQRGLQSSGNVGGCSLALHGCIKASGTYSFEKERLTSVSYTGGGGKGFDLSFGEAYNEILFYQSGNEGWWKLPFFPTQFPFTK